MSAKNPASDSSGIALPPPPALNTEMPMSWKSVRIGDIGSLYGGLSGKSAADFGTGDARYVTFLNVIENVVMKADSVATVSVRRDEKQNPVLRNDILFNQTSETPDDLALACVVPVSMPDLYLNSFCFGFRIRDRSAYDPRFLAHYFRSPVGRTIVRPLAQGATRHNLALSQFMNIRLRVPDFKTQEAISSILWDMEEQLQALDILIQKRRDMKTAVVQELLSGRTRLPGFTKTWHTHTLSDVVSFLRGAGLPKAAVVPDGGTPCVHYGELFTVYSEQIDSVISTTSESGPFVVSRQDDVLMPTSDVTPNGLCTASCLQLKGVVVGSDILILRPVRSAVVGAFLAYTIRASRRQVMQRVSGTTVFHLRVAEMASVEFRAPGIEEQAAIVTVFSDMDAEIELLRRVRRKFRSMRNAVGRQLLTGLVQASRTEWKADRTRTRTPRWHDDRSAATGERDNRQEPEGRSLAQ